MIRTKKRLGMLIAIVMAVVIFTSCGQDDQTTTAPSATTQEPITLTLVELGAETGARGKGLTWFADEIEKRTGGNVKINILWSGSQINCN